MLSDARSDQFVVNFAGQWLNLRALQSWTPAAALFPDFDDNLRLAMRKETELFVESIVHEDRSVMDLLNADYTYRKRTPRQTLRDSECLRKQFPQSGSRPGVRHAPRTAWPSQFANHLVATAAHLPVGRGKMIMQIFLGVSPPDPPPNVPALKDQDPAVHGGDEADDAPADGVSSQSGALCKLPQDHGPHRLLYGEFRRDRPMAKRGRRQSRSMPRACWWMAQS